MKAILLHLRQNWIKYGLETFVIVFSILGAFSLDNWNDNRKLRVEADKYRERLISNIITDTSNIHKALKTRQQTIDDIDRYFNFFEAHQHSLEVYIDSSSKVVEQLLRYFPVNYIFKDMQSSGRLNLLSLEEQQTMFELTNLQETYQLVAEKMMDGYHFEAREESKYLGHYWRWPVMENFYHHIGVQQSSEDLAQGLLHRHNRFIAVSGYHITQINTGNIIIEKSKEALKILRSAQ